MGSTFIPAAAAHAAVASHTDTQPSHFIQTATSANTSGNTTYINDGATNGEPGALLFVTSNYSPGGECPGGTGASNCVVDTAPVGVYYNTTKNEWGVFQEGGAAMPIGASFNVLVVPAATKDAFVVKSAATSGDTAFINNAATNAFPDAILQATPVWNPGGAGGVTNDHSIGVWYESSLKRWGVFDEDGATPALGASFNVLVGAANTGGGKVSTLVGSSTNIGVNSMNINSPATNGDSNAFVLETPNYNPKGAASGVIEDNLAAVWFNIPVETVTNPDGAPMVPKEAFNLVAYSS